MRILIRKMFNPIQQLNCTSAPWQAKESVLLSSRRAVSLGVLLHLLLVCCHGRRGLIIPHLPLLATQLLPLHRDERIQCRVINARALLKQLLPRFLAENYRNSEIQHTVKSYIAMQRGFVFNLKRMKEEAGLLGLLGSAFSCFFIWRFSLVFCSRTSG